jgi:hypothetical protein
MELDLQIPMGHQALFNHAYFPSVLATPPNSPGSFAAARKLKDVVSGQINILFFDESNPGISTENSVFASRILFTDKNELFTNINTELTKLDISGQTIIVDEKYPFAGSNWREMNYESGFIYSKNGLKIDVSDEPILEHQFSLSSCLSSSIVQCVPLGDTVFMLTDGGESCLVAAINSPPYNELFSVPIPDKIGYIEKFTTWGNGGVAFVTVGGRNKLVIMRPCSYDSDILPTLEIAGLPGACIGQTYTLNADSSYASVFWSNGENTTSINIAKFGVFSYQVADSNGCLSPPSNEVTVSFTLKPHVPEIDPPYDTVEICQGEIINLSVPASSNTLYQWSNGEEGRKISVDTPGVYVIRLLSNTGCTQPVEDTIVIIQNPNPTPATPNLNFSEIEWVCLPDSIVVEGPSGYSQYIWYIDDNEIVSTESSYTVSRYSTDNVKVSLRIVDLNGCLSATSDPVNVLFRSKPNRPQIVMDGSVLRVLAGGTFQWYINGTEIPDAISNSLNPTAAGFYQVRVVTLACASDLSEPFNYD